MKSSITDANSTNYLQADSDNYLDSDVASNANHSLYPDRRNDMHGEPSLSPPTGEQVYRAEEQGRRSTRGVDRARTTVAKGLGTDPKLTQAQEAYLIQKEIIQSGEPFEYHMIPDGHLALVGAIEILVNPDGEPSDSAIRRPRSDELFTIVGSPLIVGCDTDDIYYEYGHYAGERAYLTDGVMGEELWQPDRALALYPCMSFPDRPFVFPELLEGRSTERQPRHTSLEEALKVAGSNWIRLWYDENIESFQYAALAHDDKGVPNYPGFLWDCMDALGRAYESHPEHPLQAIIRDQQQLHAARQ